MVHTQGYGAIVSLRCGHEGDTGWGSNKAEKFANARFMIDIVAYKKMHADAAINKRRLSR